MKPQILSARCIRIAGRVIDGSRDVALSVLQLNGHKFDDAVGKCLLHRRRGRIVARICRACAARCIDRCDAIQANLLNWTDAPNRPVRYSMIG